MRLILSILVTSILLVGAGCKTTTDTTVNTDPNLNTPVDTTSEPVVDLEATTTIELPMVKPSDQKPTETKPAETKPVEKPKEEAAAPSGPKTYTMTEVKAAAAAGKCWSAISGKVYDLSSWISKHPGGQAAIKSLCGIDGTAKFMAMHAGAAKPATMLSTFFVGNLK